MKNREQSSAHPETERRLPVTHISESDKEYQSNLEKLQSQGSQRWKAFGGVILFAVDIQRGLINTLSTPIEGKTEEEKRDLSETKKAEDRVDALLQGAKDTLLRVCKDKNRFDDFFGFFQEMATSPEIVMMAGLSELDTKEIPYRLANIFLTVGFTNNVFEAMLRKHIELFEEKDRNFNERLPEVLSEFRQEVLAAIESGYLPITIEEVDRRLSETKGVLVDKLETHLGEANGDYNASYGEFRIASDLDEKDEKDATFHELVHATISGRTVILRQQEDGDKVKYQRLGLVFYNRTKDIPEKLFRWLNEAVTESISMHIQGKTDGSYGLERSVLQELYSYGVSQELVYEAYSENYTTDNPTGSRVPAWKRFAGAIKKLYPQKGVRALQEAERNIKQYYDEERTRLAKLTAE
ncbi:MAG: hypothetical protein WC817_00930 [Patescibacteria group bacterium]|jgi:hypothetical protein